MYSGNGRFKGTYADPKNPSVSNPTLFVKNGAPCVAYKTTGGKPLADCGFDFYLMEQQNSPFYGPYPKGQSNPLFTPPPAADMGIVYQSKCNTHILPCKATGSVKGIPFNRNPPQTGIYTTSRVRHIDDYMCTYNPGDKEACCISEPFTISNSDGQKFPIPACSAGSIKGFIIQDSYGTNSCVPIHTNI